jgi:hypothetical protein
MVPPPPPARTLPPALSRRQEEILGTVAIGMVAMVVALANIPVPQTVSTYWGATAIDDGSVTFEHYYAQPWCPYGAVGTLNFSSWGVLTRSTVLAPNGSEVWQSNETNWTIHFTIQSCGAYAVYTNGTAYTNGTDQGTYQYTLTLRYDAPYL